MRRRLSSDAEVASLLAVQFEFRARWRRASAAEAESIEIDGEPVPLRVSRNPRARRYVLRVQQDSSVRLTIPRGGSLAFGLEFAGKNRDWIRDQQHRRQAEAQLHRAWVHGTEILLRGERVTIRVQLDQVIPIVEFGSHTIPLAGVMSDLRPPIEAYLRSLAEKELIPRVWQLASQYQLKVHRVLVRNQRSRWGSCSARRTISLNWRLIQAPPYVRDYLIVHELMHLREMNHSRRFWRCVATVCPDYPQAEAWLDAHSQLLK